jgi:hypothetical protein
MKNLIYLALIIALFSCKKKDSVVTPATPTASIVGKWTFKTIKNLDGTKTINAKAGATIDITATSYTASQSLPFTSTTGTDNYTFEAKGGTMQMTTIKLVKSVLSTMAVDAKSKAELDTYLAKYEAEGVKDIALLSGMSMIVKSKSGSVTIPWQLYNIKELTSSKLVLSLFYGELLSGTTTPIDERLTITLEK